jgi:FMN phosphatase YigB (HAD superfamily)
MTQYWIKKYEHASGTYSRFERCFEKILNFCREETFIIEDSLISDMKGGENAEIRTIWYNLKSMENDRG